MYACVSGPGWGGLNVEIDIKSLNLTEMLNFGWAS